MGFGGGLALALPDRAYALALVRAYNDWHVHEWAGGAPGRFIALAVLPLWDIPAAVAEVKRLAGMGVHAVSIPDNPAFTGELPSIHSDRWDPLWKVCAESGVALCCHIGTGALPPHTTLDEPVDAWMTTTPLATSMAAADWMFAPMWKKFPELRLVLSEAGIGWVPYLMERADFIYDHHHAWTNSDFAGERPSDVFRRHFYVCFIDDKFGLKNRHEVGIDRITWECDYPHSDCTWPKSPEILWDGAAGLPTEDIAKITHLNAMRIFHYDPITFLGRENCTIRALRKHAAHVKTGPFPGLGGKKPGGHAPVTIRDMRAALAGQTEGTAA
jgi:predicted TIM-barrel fold metal-dependent hydrolase